MPGLYCLNANNPSPPTQCPWHYFPSAKWGTRGVSSTWSWIYDLDVDFEAQSYIHIDQLDYADTEFWIALRKDAERRYSGDCFYVRNRKDYRRWWNLDAKCDYNKDYATQRHGYWSFYFEEASDQTMFILQHAERLSSKRYRFHPEMGVSCKDKRYDVDEDEKLDAWRV
jgi:hypothetical protein